MEDATERAGQAVADLVADGPMSIVSAERDRIVERTAKADTERERWVSAAARLHDRSEQHRVEHEPQRELAEAADAKVAALLAEVTESLAQEATTDGAELLAAQQAAYTAHRAKANAPRFRKRFATRTAEDADARREAVERIAHGKWQSIPHSESGLPAWAEAVAQRQADHAPEIIEARAEVAGARQIAKEIAARQSRERTALYERLLENRRPDGVAARVKNLHEQATRDRRYFTQLDALPSNEAVQLVRERAARKRLSDSPQREHAKLLALVTRPTNETSGGGRMGRAVMLADACDHSKTRAISTAADSAATRRRRWPSVGSKKPMKTT